MSELMERAGAAVEREAMLAFPAARSFACVGGGGSNGGDGRVAARILRQGGPVAEETTEPKGYDVVLDALFGTGFRGAPQAEAGALIARVNAAAAPVVSVDLPSGVDASTGEIASAVVDADPRSRRPGPATCSPASWPPSWRKGLKPRLAAAAAAIAHGRAAALVEHQAGLVASDLLASLPRALEP